MLLALKDDKLNRAAPGGHATCPYCGEDVIPICGSIRIHHWRHEVGECIYYTEPETDWHLEWKDRALKLGLEIEKRFDEHIADIYDPDTNTVIEVQHSPISEEEILDRCIYYSVNDINIQWIFDHIEKYKQGHIEFGQYLHGNIEIEFTEKWFPKSIERLLEYWYDISLHCTYDDNKMPILFKILNNHKYYSSIIYRFNNFNNENLLKKLDELTKLRQEKFLEEERIRQLQEDRFKELLEEERVKQLQVKEKEIEILEERRILEEKRSEAIKLFIKHREEYGKRMQERDMEEYDKRKKIEDIYKKNTIANKRLKIYGTNTRYKIDYT